MAYVKYTRDMLTEAVAASISMAGVVRHLGLPQNGGAHAHLSRRVTQLGIDTSHFLGKGHARGTHSPRRLRADEILIERPPDRMRQKPPVLRRALQESGRPYLCAECGSGDTWNGRRLTLQVDHIDGRFWDCRPENLRFLCPNCHTQTGTFAGRNQSRQKTPTVRVDDHGNPIVTPEEPKPLTEEEKVEVLQRVKRRELTVADAARTLGCHTNQVYKLALRWETRGTLTPAPRQRRISDLDRAEVVALDSANPTWGMYRVAEALRSRPSSPLKISASTVANILKESRSNTEQT